MTTQLTTAHFTDARIDEIISGDSPLTTEERDFLLRDTPRFEECLYSKAELEAMDDQHLMDAAYWTWADYCR